RMMLVKNRRTCMVPKPIIVQAALLSTAFFMPPREGGASGAVVSGSGGEPGGCSAGGRSLWRGREAAAAARSPAGSSVLGCDGASSVLMQRNPKEALSVGWAESSRPTKLVQLLVVSGGPRRGAHPTALRSCFRLLTIHGSVLVCRLQCLDHSSRQAH